MIDPVLPRLMAMARRLLRHEADAEDAVQTTLLKAIEHLADYRGDAPFDHWLMRIAANTSLKMLRRRRGVSLDAVSQDGDPLPMPQRIADWRPGVASQVMDAEFRAALDEALDTLDEGYRVVFVLRDMQGLTVRETAAAMSLSESNVKVRLMRARLMLRERLTHRFGDGPDLQPVHPHDHAHPERASP